MLQLYRSKESRETKPQLFSKHLPWKRFCGSLASITAILRPIPEEQPVISTTFCPGLAMTTLLGLQSGCHFTAKLRDNKRIREKDRVTRVTWTTRLQNSLVLSVLSFIYSFISSWDQITVFALNYLLNIICFPLTGFIKKRKEEENKKNVKTHVVLYLSIRCTFSATKWPLV